MKKLITLLFLIPLFSGVLKAQTTVTRVVQPNLERGNDNSPNINEKKSI